MNDNDAIYLRAPEYDEINTVKINLTKGERDVLGVVENLIVNGLVTDEQYDNIVTFVEKEQELGVEKDEIIKTAAADYDLEMDRSNILVSGAMAELSMSVYGWNRTMCSSFNSAKLATILKNGVESWIEVESK